MGKTWFSRYGEKRAKVCGALGESGPKWMFHKIEFASSDLEDKTEEFLNMFDIFARACPSYRPKLGHICS